MVHVGVSTLVLICMLSGSEASAKTGPKPLEHTTVTIPPTTQMSSTVMTTHSPSSTVLMTTPAPLTTVMTTHSPSSTEMTTPAPLTTEMTTPAPLPNGMKTPSSNQIEKTIPSTKQTEMVVETKPESKWISEFVKDVLNVANWRFSNRSLPDNGSKLCTLTGPHAGSTAAPRSGCGWTVPFFCDETVNMLIKNITQPTKNASKAGPPGYTFYRDVGYVKVHTESKSWKQAKDVCQAEGAHLAVPSTDAEYAAILSAIKDSRHKLSNPSLYIGFTDEALEGDFLTVLGQSIHSFEQVRFGKGEPNNGNGGFVENCVELEREFGHLNDCSCGTPKPFICEQLLPGLIIPCANEAP